MNYRRGWYRKDSQANRSRREKEKRSKGVGSSTTFSQVRQYKLCTHRSNRTNYKQSVPYHIRLSSRLYAQYAKNLVFSKRKFLWFFLFKFSDYSFKSQFRAINYSIWCRTPSAHQVPNSSNSHVKYTGLTVLFSTHLIFLGAISQWRHIRIILK